MSVVGKGQALAAIRASVRHCVLLCSIARWEHVPGGGQGGHLRSNQVPAEVIEELVPVHFVLEGLVEVQLAGGDVRQHAQRRHVHKALRQQEQVDAHLHPPAMLLPLCC